MYSSYTTGGPRAFLPHSAINLSVKTDSTTAASGATGGAGGLHSSSLDLSVSEAAAAAAASSQYLLGQAGSAAAAASSYSTGSAVTGSQILDLTRTTMGLR